MGLFSKKKTYVSAQTMSMIEETPDIIQSSVTTSILKSRDIAPDIIGNYLNGIYVKARQYYRYGRDTYVHGLPEGTKEVFQTNNIAVANAIQSEVGYPVTLVTCTLDFCDANFFAIPWLVDNRGYNESTDIVTSHPALPAGETGPVYYVDVTITATDTLELRYSYVKTTGDTGFVTETITMVGVEPDVYFYHAEYIEKGADGSDVTRWAYNTTDGTYPELSVDPGVTLNSPYFPVAIVRQNNRDVQEGDDDYPTTRKLLDIIGIDLDDVVTGIQENPDQSDIDHAYIIMGVDISTDLPNSWRYLHDYFVYLHSLNPATKSAYDNWASNAAAYPAYSNTPVMNTVNITDGQYNIDMGYLYTERTIVTGTLAEPMEREVNFNTPIGGDSWSANTDEIVFRRQLDEDTYSEVRVYGLMHINHVYGGKTVDTSLADAFYRDSEGDQTNGNFVVPLNNNILQSMGLQKGNELMYDAIKIVFNSYEVVKLKWYQTGFFKFVTIVVAIAVTVITYQPGALTQSIVGASAVAGLSTLTLVLTDIVVAFAIKKGFEMVAEVLPSNIAFALAIAFAAYAAGSVMSTGSLAGLPFASEALMAANNLTEATMEVAFEELNAEIQGFQDEAAKKTAELEELWEELEVGVDLDPMDIFTDFGQEQYFETPSAFLYRTVHAGNPGVSTLDSINYYVDNKLSLPTLSPGLGVNINV